MGLPRRSERLFHPDMKLTASEPEPTASAVGEQRRLFDLGQSEQLAVEAAGSILAARGRSDLYVVESGDGCHGEARPSYSDSGFPPTAMNASPFVDRHDEPREARVDAQVLTIRDRDSGTSSSRAYDASWRTSPGSLD